MLNRSPMSPEMRRRHMAPVSPRRTGLSGRAVDVVQRVAVGVYSDGFIHAGNFAYLSLVALFPFFIVAATIARTLGNTAAGLEAVNGFLLTVPRGVAEAMRGPIAAVLSERASRGVVGLGVIVGLWTSASLIETMRDILRRAYGTRPGRPFWHYRLISVGAIMLTVAITMTALSAQVALNGVDEVLRRVLPFTDATIGILAATRLVPMAVVATTLYILFLLLTPDPYRGSQFPKWPGAVLTSSWWYGTLLLLPVVLGHLATYGLTYGSLAGVMITLIFFFLVGLGVVIGAELNAALAEFPEQESMSDAEAGREEMDE